MRYQFLEKKKFNIDIDRNYWSAAFTATKETRLGTLQWKILHNVYPTNILLKKMGIADSETCNACNSGDKGYIEHFFYACDKIKPIWKIIETEIKARTNKTVQINEQILKMRTMIITLRN